MARIEPVFSSIDSGIENPYQLSNAQLIEDDVEQFSSPKIFSSSGRLSLTRYWLFYIPFCLFIPTIVLAFFILGLRDNPIVAAVVAATILIPSCLLSLSLLTRRARDLGWSPVWGILSVFIPLFGMLIMLLLVTLPGRRKTNKYGPPNSPLSTSIKVFTGFLVLFSFAASFAFFVFLPDLISPELYGWFSNP